MNNKIYFFLIVYFALSCSIIKNRANIKEDNFVPCSVSQIKFKENIFSIIDTILQKNKEIDSLTNFITISTYDNNIIFQTKEKAIDIVRVQNGCQLYKNYLVCYFNNEIDTTVLNFSHDLDSLYLKNCIKSQFIYDFNLLDKQQKYDIDAMYLPESICLIKKNNDTLNIIYSAYDKKNGAKMLKDVLILLKN